MLLEYLVKNGSERVVDDARSHVSMIKMMKNFHYVDEKGKDQGINGMTAFFIMSLQFLTIFYSIVRNRAKELAELLGDVDTIKAERKKAKKNRNKYTGVGSEGGMSFGASSMGGGGGGGGGSGRYEGFGSDSNYSSGGGGYENGASNDFFDDERPGRYDDFDSPSSNQRRSSNKSDSLSPPPRKVSDAKPKAKTAKDLNLFDFDEPVATSSASKDKGKSNNDDDWGDFADGDGNGKLYICKVMEII